MSRYYYHGVNHGLVLDKAIEIFQSGGIRCTTGARKIGFNGTDYISICRKELEEEYSRHSNNGFYNYVQDRICFIISEEVEAIKPEIIEHADKWNRFELIAYMNSKPNVRFSDMFDEWQVKGLIPFSSIMGIGIPLQNLSAILTKTDSNNGSERLEKLLSLAESLGLDIVDSSDPQFVEKYEKNKESGMKASAVIKIFSTLGRKYE